MENQNFCVFLIGIVYMKVFCRQAPHNEILGSYLKQHHQHHIFRAHFQAEPQSQAQAKKEDRLYKTYFRSKLTVSRVPDNIALEATPLTLRPTQLGPFTMNEAQY